MDGQDCFVDIGTVVSQNLCEVFEGQADYGLSAVGVEDESSDYRDLCEYDIEIG